MDSPPREVEERMRSAEMKNRLLRNFGSGVDTTAMEARYSLFTTLSAQPKPFCSLVLVVIPGP